MNTRPPDGNKFGVSLGGSSIAFLFPPAAQETFSPADALNLAAWIFVLTGMDKEAFDAAVQEVLTE